VTNNCVDFVWHHHLCKLGILFCRAMLGWIFCLTLCCASVYGRSTYGEALSLPAKGIMDSDEKYILRWMKDGENMIFEVRLRIPL